MLIKSACSNISSRDEMDDIDADNRRQITPQACETCRSRKVKCDGELPQCGVCQKLGAECVYREPKPTKKDKTMTHILDTMRSLELKIDQLLPLGSPVSSSSSAMSMPVSTSTAFGSHENNLSQLPHQPTPQRQFPNLGLIRLSPSRDTPVPRKALTSLQIEARSIISWPAIDSLLRPIIRGIPNWGVGPSNSERWLTSIALPKLPIVDGVNFGLVGGAGSRGWDTGIPLTKMIIERLCHSYFSTIHCACPLLDRNYFMAVTLPEAYRGLFGLHDESSIIVLAILALGELAEHSLRGDAIVDPSNKRNTGIRGGSSDKPPGLAYLQEANRRLGLFVAPFGLVTLQVSVLMSVYYSQSSRNLEYWHMTSFACSVCKHLVKVNDKWNTFEGDLLARAYWMCTILECGLTCELALPPSGILDVEPAIHIPVFSTAPSLKKSASAEDHFIECHFLAQLSLGTQIYQVYGSFEAFSSPFQLDALSTMPRRAIVQEHLRALREWRAMLPREIAWSEDDIWPTIDSTMTSNLRAEPVWHLTQSILSASLRTRYKYAGYLLWRPYLYKVLHMHSAPTAEDLQACRNAIRACCMWPLTFPLFQDVRRLVPHQYELTHAFAGILILMYACSCNEVLADVLEEPELHGIWISSRSFLLSWIRDFQVIHPVANWAWQLIRVLYADEA